MLRCTLSHICFSANKKAHAAKYKGQASLLFSTLPAAPSHIRSCAIYRFTPAKMPGKRSHILYAGKYAWLCQHRATTYEVIKVQAASEAVLIDKCIILHFRQFVNFTEFPYKQTENEKCQLCNAITG